MKTKIIFALAMCLVACLCFSGCADKGPGNNLISREEETEFKPTPDVDVNSDLLQKYNSHKENAPLAFTANSENPASDFEYSQTDDGVVIDKYIGQGDIVVIPEAIEGKSVISLSENSFKESAVRAVYVPDTVKTIKSGAFEGAKNLSTIRVPFIGNGEGDLNGGCIFGSEDHISNAIKVPGSLKMLIVGEGETEISSNSLSYFKNLEAIVLPDTVKKIGQFAFYECRSLVYVDFGGTKAIEEYAFTLCDSLISIEIPDMVEQIRLGAFMQCNSLKYISLPYIGSSKTENQYIGYIFGAENKAWNNSFVPASLSYVTVTGEVVPDMAFEGCENLIEVTLSSRVKSIGERAFSNCKSMQSIQISDSVTSIGANAFSNCYTLSKIELSSKSALTSIGMQCFLNCRSLKKVTLPSGVSTLPSGVFSGCVSLEEFDGAGIAAVDDTAFRGCEKLNPIK